MTAHERPIVVVVEDDAEIQRLVRDLLAQEGFAVETASSGGALDQLLLRLRPDLILLDLMLPGEDGLAICQRLRKNGDTPILMLTAKADPIDRVVGLEIGADDYLTKPFNPRELLARVRALLRRGAGACARLRISAPVRVRRAHHRSRCAAPHQCGIGAGSADERGVRAAGLLRVEAAPRGRSAERFDRTIDVTISRLRKKIEAAVPGLNPITTVRNNGYLFVPAVRPLVAKPLAP
jgi:two-component system, OmpR family, response regulator